MRDAASRRGRAGLVPLAGRPLPSPPLSPILAPCQAPESGAARPAPRRRTGSSSPRRASGGAAQSRLDRQPQGFAERRRRAFRRRTNASARHVRRGGDGRSLKSLLELGDPNIRGGRPWTPHRPPRPDKSEGGRRFQIVANTSPRRPAARRSPSWWRASSARARSGAAGRHRLGQDLHHGAGHRGDAAPGADPRAQQDAGGAALRRVQELLPRQCGRVFRLLLRLLPARGLCAAHRHLYREGIVDQRADRPHAPFGDARAAGARRRHHRRLGLLHLRHRLGRDLFRDDLLAEPATRSTSASSSPTWSRCNTSARSGDFGRGVFRVRGDTIEIFPAHYEDRAWRIGFSATRSRRSTNSIR